MNARSTVLTALVAWGIAACGNSTGPHVTASAGGDTTMDDRSSHAFENPAPNLDADGLDRHLTGDVAFEAVFVSPPAELNPGLGPLYVNNACNGCHVKNGRGRPVAGTGPGGSHLLVRVSLSEGDPVMPGGVVPVPGLGDQLQDHATFGVAPEVTVDLSWEELDGAYDDGTPYTLRRPVLNITDTDGQPLDTSIRTSPRVPSPVFGLGLLEQVPDAVLLERADPDDLDGNGISGRPNTVWDVAQQAAVIGRFGWKANQPNLVQQAAGAYGGDMGVTTTLFSESDGSSEVDEDTLDAAAFYTRSLAVPARGPRTPRVREGETLFEQVGCASCHRPELRTGESSFELLAHQQFAPYTDLLLHDMGDGLADGRRDFEATGNEWRTPPLWGIGLVPTVLGSESYLHDGRARTLEEAILWHGGEAEATTHRFRALGADQRDALIRFLRSL